MPSCWTPRHLSYAKIQSRLLARAAQCGLIRDPGLQSHKFPTLSWLESQRQIKGSVLRLDTPFWAMSMGQITVKGQFQFLPALPTSQAWYISHGLSANHVDVVPQSALNQTALPNELYTTTLRSPTCYTTSTKSLSVRPWTELQWFIFLHGRE